MYWGGFVVGNLVIEYYWCVRLCWDEEMVVVLVDYRLVFENRFLFGLDDCE